MSNDMAIEIEMDCTVCGRYSTAAVCPACAPPAITINTSTALLGVDGAKAAQRDGEAFYGIAPRGAQIQDEPAGIATDVAALQSITSEASANAAVQGAGSLAGGQLAGVGFTGKDGYITAIRNGVPARTHEGYLNTLRSRYGMTSADIAALALPGPMTMADLPTSTNPTVHVPSGPSIFDRPRAERGIKLGAAPASEDLKTGDLQSGRLVGLAKSDGHGVVIAWNGRRTVKRADLQSALAAVGMEDMMPRAKSAKAQAGRTLNAMGISGYVVRAERRAAVGQPKYDARWTVGAVNHVDADTLANRVAQATLVGDVLTVESDDQMIKEKITAGYAARIGDELYQAGDVTDWLGGKLARTYHAIAFGALGWYVPARHVAEATKLCETVASIGFGAGWVLPGLPVADSDTLRDGLVRSLIEEVADVMDRLATERAAVRAAETPRSDIGPKRAASFLADLRKIGERVVAYETVLGTERVAAARAQIKASVADLEGVLGEEHAGICARFQGVWEEIERDIRKSGGVL